MLTKLLSSICFVFSLFIAGCHLGSNDSGTVAYVADVSLGQLEIIDGSDDGSCCHPRASNIGFDDEGNAIVVMLKNGEIWANRYEAGKGWGTPVRLDATVPPSNFPAIAVAGNGNALAAWIHPTTITSGYYYTSYYDRDLGWGEPVRLNDIPGGFSRSISISVDANENYLLVWEEVAWEGISQSGTIWSKKFSPVSGWQDEEIISNGTGATAQPTVRLNSIGHGFAVWGQEKGDPALFILNGARYDPLTGWEPAVEFNTGNAGPAITHIGNVRQFVVDEDGEALFAWLQDKDTSIFTYEDDIFINQYTNVNGWGAPELLQLNTPGRGEQPFIGISGNGTALLVWNEGLFPNAQSWYRIYNKATGWTTRQRIDAVGGEEFVSNLSVNEQGNAVAQWSAYVNGKTRIFISRYTMNGTWTASKEIDVGSIHVPTGVKMVLDNQNMITITFDGYAARLPF